MNFVVAKRAEITEKYALTLIIAFCAFFHACKKTDHPPALPPPEPPGTKIGLLKQIVVQSLPSPLYHFDYTDSGVATGINFASGFYIYQLEWKDKRLARMINSFNQNALIYTYNNGRITGIREVRTNNSAPWHYRFDYNNNNQVKEIRWHRISPNGADSIVWRKVLLSYHPDGNLSKYEDYRNLTGTQEWVQSVQYLSFDNGKNVDDFNILKEFDDNLLYLPGIKLQRNNPTDILITGVQNDYELTYTWTYQNGVPVTKQARLKNIRGNQVGTSIVSSTSYTYY